jgi:hypothetical protein
MDFRRLAKADGYYKLMFEWIKGRHNPPYGNAKFETPPGK